jgi:hypothetical protein
MILCLLSTLLFKLINEYIVRDDDMMSIHEQALLVCSLFTSLLCCGVVCGEGMMMMIGIGGMKRNAWVISLSLSLVWVFN